MIICDFLYNYFLETLPIEEEITLAKTGNHDEIAIGMLYLNFIFFFKLITMKVNTCLV